MHELRLIEINVKIAKYVGFIVVCVECTKIGVYNFVFGSNSPKKIFSISDTKIYLAS